LSNTVFMKLNYIHTSYLIGSESHMIYESNFKPLTKNVLESGIHNGVI